MSKILRYIFHRDHFIVVLSGLLLLGLLRVITINIDFLNPIADALDNFSVTDIIFEIQHDESKAKTNEMITLVDMTELSDRGDIANLLQEINVCEPLVVGIDLIFEGRKDDPLANELLMDAVNALGDKAIFSTKLVDYNSEDEIFTRSVRSFFAEEIPITEAYTNLNDDMEGRRIRDFSIKQPLLGDTLMSFPAKIASRFNGSVQQLDFEDLLINFKNEDFPVVKYDEIAQNAELIEGHVVLVGTMLEEQDMHNTPLGKMPGMKLQAYSLLTLLEQKVIKKTPVWIEWLLVFLICYLLEITIDLVWQFVKKKDRSAIFVFLKESNIVSVILLFFWMIVVCWIMYILFIRNSIIINGGLILAMMALVCEARDILMAIIKGVKAKKGDITLITTSILNEDN